MASATGSIVNRKCNGYATENAYQMRLIAEETGNTSGDNQEVRITLQGYCINPGGYQSYGSPMARIQQGGTVLAGNSNVNSWWPRNTWITLRQYTGWFSSGTNHTFTGYYNSNSTTAWLPLNGEWSCSVTLYTTPIPTAPSGSISHSNVARNSATITLSVSTWGNHSSAHGSTPYNRTINGESYNNTSASQNITGLTPNTLYEYSGFLRNNYGLVSSTYSGSFTTIGNIPSISSVSVSNISTTGATINYSVSYDTNASYKAREIQYGVSTSYGSSTTNNVLSNLLPDTMYYYRIRIQDNWNRWSNWSTGSFTTLADSFCKLISSSGSVNGPYKLYAILSNGTRIEVTKNNVHLIN